MLKSTEAVYRAVEKLSVLFTIAPVTGTMINAALSLRWRDFEDAVQFVTAMENDVAFIVTRDMSGFEAATIPCISPATFLLRY